MKGQSGISTCILKTYSAGSCLDISDLSKGMYLIKIAHNQGVQVNKFIKF